jgi:cbb3-type cytochrome oxidase maturation protein
VEVILVVLPVALVLAGLALWACLASIRGGQFDDLDTPPVRALLEDVPTADE